MSRQAKWQAFRIALPSLAALIVFALATYCRGENPVAKRLHAFTVSRDKAKERIGELAFFDKEVMSLNGAMSCATCHDPDPKKGWSNGMKLAVGARNTIDPFTQQPRIGLLGVINVPVLWDCYSKIDKPCNADGRAKGLGEACFQAIADPLVFQMPSIEAVVNRMNKKPRYLELAKLAYGSDNGLRTVDQFRECMVKFLCTIRWDDLPADKLARGEETNIPESAKRGWLVFETHCISCHQPDNNWRDDEFHDIGIAARSGSTNRLRGAVTNDPRDNFKVATPTLRGIANSPPYMHDGSMETTEEVVGFFARGGRFVIGGQMKRAVNIDPLVAEINLNKQDVYDLNSFMHWGFQDEHYPWDGRYSQSNATLAVGEP